MSLPMMPTPTPALASPLGLKNDLSSNFGIGEGNGDDERSGDAAIGVDVVANPKVLIGVNALEKKAG